MIRVENLTKSYRTGSGRHYVFRNVDLDFPDGVNIGIIGPNGAGKSTLLRILGGIDFPDSGRIVTDQRMSWPLGVAGGFVGHASGRDNCKMICRLYGLKAAEIRQRIVHIQTLADIGKYFEEPVRYYSSGMRSRLAFALSMAFDFDYFLIDEVTAVGDQKFKEQAKKSLDEKRATSKVIMVSHQMNTIRDFCDVAIVLINGKLTVYEDMDEAVAAYLPKQQGQKNDLKVKKAKEIAAGILNVEAQRQVSQELIQVISTRLREINEALANKAHIRNATAFWHNLAEAYGRLGNLAEAVHCQRRALESTDDRLDLRRKLITLLLQRNDFSGAQEALEQGYRFHGRQMHLLKLEAQILQKKGDMTGAADCHREALALRPELPSLNIEYAVALFNSGDYEDALHYVLTAIDLQPKSPMSFLWLSRILAALNRFSESAAALSKHDELQVHKVKQAPRADQIFALIRDLVEKAAAEMNL